jgi:histidinol-phosphatase (PHP family)
MISPIDYHVHSSNSWDTRVSMKVMCQEAIDKGISEIAFTEHFDHFTEDKTKTAYLPDRYFEDLRTNRATFANQGLSIRAGVEVGEYHLYRETVQPVIDAYDYDIVLGSLHWINGTENVFQPSYYAGKTLREAVIPYFAEMVEMIEGGGFDILSHMDVFKRRAHLIYGEFAVEEFETEVRDVWQACIDHGIGIEINTGGMRWRVNEPHPNLTSLKWYREMGGEILTIGSDAHNPADLGYGLDYTIQMAIEAGFAALSRFEKRQVAEFIPLT